MEEANVIMGGMTATNRRTSRSQSEDENINNVRS